MHPLSTQTDETISGIGNDNDDGNNFVIDDDEGSGNGNEDKFNEVVVMNVSKTQR